MTSNSSEYYSVLPNLPGFRPQVTYKKGKTAYLQIVDGGNFLVDKKDNLPNISNLNSTENKNIQGTTSLISSTSSLAPKQRIRSNIEDINVILTFQAYFEEDVPYNENELIRNRIRKCTIIYYAETGCLAVMERQQQNSGMSQGTLVRKDLIYKPDQTLISPLDLIPGQTVVIYKRQYNITSCDEFTKKYFSRVYDIQNIETFETPIDAHEAYRLSLENGPSDEWSKYRSKKNENKIFTEAMLGNTFDNSTRYGFSKYGSQKLKFKCIWDNSANLYGDVTEYNLIYHLCDDTLEINVHNPKSSAASLYKSSDQVSRLLKRSKLPKSSLTSAANNIGANNNSIQYYKWADFQIGMEINVYSRNLRLVDADKFTREFYLANGHRLNDRSNEFGSEYGEDSSGIISFNTTIIPAREIPPPTGFGSDEDSLRSCFGSLQLSPPKPKKLGENKVLSFTATLYSGGPDDTNRKFVVMYFVQDATLKILEPPVRNSGFVGGTFLSRREVKLSNGEKLSEVNIYMGAKLSILNNVFLLHETNENTLRWMEERNLPKANIYLVLIKLHDNVNLTDRIRSSNDFINKLGKDMSYAELSSVLNSYSLLGDEDYHLVEHEVMTIYRYFKDREVDGAFDCKKFVDSILDPSKVEMY